MNREVLTDGAGPFAFDECLADLEWLHAESYLTLLLNANLILSDEPASEFATFAKIVSYVADEWAKKKKRFEVLFHCEEAELDALLSRFQRSPEIRNIPTFQ